MSRLHQHAESHLVARIGWLRAAVLGANDGIVSTASLIVGVAAAAAKPGDVLIAGVAGLVAGAMSMAAGEYVSVSSQSDTEQADLSRERKELSQNVGFEEEELAQIYVQRGVETNLARQVAQQLMAKDALGAHARDELGISEITTARPIQAAFTSAATFSVGAALPLLMVLITPTRFLVAAVSVASLVVSGASRSDRCTSRGRRCHQSDSACDVLGCFRHGPDGRRWRDIWHGGLIGPLLEPSNSFVTQSNGRRQRSFSKAICNATCGYYDAGGIGDRDRCRYLHAVLAKTVPSRQMRKDHSGHQACCAVRQPWLPRTLPPTPVGTRMSETIRRGQSSAAYRQSHPEVAAWAPGYGVIEHGDLSQVRLYELAERLVTSGRASNLKWVFQTLRAADRLASAAMWLVVHMTYARTVDLSSRLLLASDFKTVPEDGRLAQHGAGLRWISPCQCPHGNHPLMDHGSTPLRRRDRGGQRPRWQHVFSAEGTLLAIRGGPHALVLRLLLLCDRPRRPPPLGSHVNAQ